VSGEFFIRDSERETGRGINKAEGRTDEAIRGDFYFRLHLFDLLIHYLFLSFCFKMGFGV
jgi:hypothetical protein